MNQEEVIDEIDTDRGSQRVCKFGLWTSSRNYDKGVLGIGSVMIQNISNGGLRETKLT